MEVIYTQFYKCSGRVRGRVVAKAGDRLWLDMCQLMIWQEQIKRWVCLWETRSSKLEAVTDSLFLWQTVCICDRPSVSVTDSLWQTVCDRHSLCLSQTVCVCNIQSVSFTDSLCLSQTDYVCHSQFVSVTDCLRLSQAVCVCHTQSVSVTDSLCLSQTIFVCHRQSVSDTDTLLDHSWPGFHLFIYDFHQDLSVRFEFVRRLNTTNTNFVDPWLPWWVLCFGVRTRWS